MRKPHIFAGIPLPLREALEDYALGLEKLTINILEKMAKALKMDSDEMRELFSECYQAMRMNYYPPCPKADQVVGFSPHSDGDALTIVLQLNETDGLQILKDGKWLPQWCLPQYRAQGSCKFNKREAFGCCIPLNQFRCRDRPCT
ncbi:hypothetical protein MKW92_008866 [Papaver armeniacum]|nr:hypothetical protein MKW92_008866 [Papaver armeniacum]